MAKKKKVFSFRALMDDLWFQLKLRRAGLIVGGLTGLAAAYFLVSAGYDLYSLRSAGTALADNLLGRNASVSELAVRKLYFVLLLVGSSVGYLLDALLDYYFLTFGKRSKRRGR